MAFIFIESRIIIGKEEMYLGFQKILTDFQI